MTRDEFDALVMRFADAGLQVESYPKTYLINAHDCDDVIQSYYASTGTAIFRDGNGRNAKRVTVRNMPHEKFISLCRDNSTEDIQEIYFG